MISLIGFIIAVCAMAVLWNYFDRGMEELKVIKEREKVFFEKNECYAHKKKNIYCEDCMKIAQNVAKQDEHDILREVCKTCSLHKNECVLHEREKIYCCECLTTLQQHGITVKENKEDQLEASRHLCEQCSMARFGHVTTQLSGGICECCKSKRIHWVRDTTKQTVYEFVQGERRMPTSGHDGSK